MTTKDIIKDMEKVVDEFTISHKGDLQCKCISGARGHLIAKLRTHLRTLLESFGEEVIGQDTRHITDSKGIQNIVDENEGNVSFDEIANEVQKDIDVQNELRAEQRLKVKEILSNLK